MIAPIQPGASPAHAAPARPQAPASPTEAAETVAPAQAQRLIIDRDGATGAYAFTLVDAAAGAVMSRFPVRAARDISHPAAYHPGSIASLRV